MSWIGKAGPEPSIAAPIASGSGGLRRVTARITGRIRSRAVGSSVLLYATMPALSALNAVVGLVLPMLLGPAAFGEYSLAVTLFQYGLIFDLGLSQTIDRRVPVLMTGQARELRIFVAEMLTLRLCIAAVVMAGGLGALAALALTDRLPFRFVDGGLSLAAGLSFMIALGPMSVWRAQSNRRAFALASAATGLALAVSRPAGMIAGGITGSFVLLFACFAAIAVVLPTRLPAPRHAAMLPPRKAARYLADSLPLFLTSILWAVYMTANRWVVSFVAPPLALGHFAFGANVLALVVGMVAAMSQFYYPAVAARVAAGPRGSVSGLLLRDLCCLAGAGLAIGLAGIVTGPLFIELLYRNFVGSEAPMRILLVALPSLVVCSWLVPLGLATAVRPWLESGVTLPLGLLSLGAATWGGYRLGGIEGSAWGSCLTAPLLLLLLLGACGRNGLMSRRHIAWLAACAGLATALLAGAVLATTMWAAGAYP